jgi:transposase
MKLSPKFPAAIVNPTIPGVYLTQRPKGNCPFWRAFDGDEWYFGVAAFYKPSPSFDAALLEGKIGGDLVNFFWQGVAEQPKEDSK